MPYRFEFDPEHGIARVQMAGHVTGEELVQFYREASEVAENLTIRAGVADLSHVTSFDVTLDIVRKLAAMRPVLADPKIPRVIIVRGMILFGMARLFESEGQATRPNLHVVRTEREAWAILGTAEPRFVAYQQKSRKDPGGSAPSPTE